MASGDKAANGDAGAGAYMTRDQLQLMAGEMSMGDIWRASAVVLERRETPGADRPGRRFRNVYRPGPTRGFPGGKPGTPGVKRYGGGDVALADQAALMVALRISAAEAEAIPVDLADAIVALLRRRQ